MPQMKAKKKKKSEKQPLKAESSRVISPKKESLPSLPEKMARLGGRLSNCLRHVWIWDEFLYIRGSGFRGVDYSDPCGSDIWVFNFVVEKCKVQDQEVKAHLKEPGVLEGLINSVLSSLSAPTSKLPVEVQEKLSAHWQALLIAGANL